MVFFSMILDDGEVWKSNLILRRQKLFSFGSFRFLFNGTSSSFWRDSRSLWGDKLATFERNRFCKNFILFLLRKKNFDKFGRRKRVHFWIVKCYSKKTNELLWSLVKFKYISELQVNLIKSPIFVSKCVFFLFFFEFSIRGQKQWDGSTANNETYLY